MLPRSMVAPWFAALLMSASGCGGESPAAASSAAPSSAGATAAATTASAAATAKASASATATSAATASEPAPPTSPEPTLKEWDAAKPNLELVKHWDRPGCMPRRVREWIRVGCSGQMLQKGNPVEIRILKGFKPTPLSIMSERAETIWLIFPFTEGLDGSAVYSFEGGSFTFTAKWPKGEPEPKVVGNFEELAAPEAPSSPRPPHPPRPRSPASPC